jgi:hypothetical protein
MYQALFFVDPNKAPFTTKREESNEAQRTISLIEDFVDYLRDNDMLKTEGLGYGVIDHVL